MGYLDAVYLVVQTITTVGRWRGYAVFELCASLCKSFIHCFRAPPLMIYSVYCLLYEFICALSMADLSSSDLSQDMVTSSFERLAIGSSLQRICLLVLALSGPRSELLSPNFSIGRKPRFSRRSSAKMKRTGVEVYQSWSRDISLRRTLLLAKSRGGEMPLFPALWLTILITKGSSAI